MDTGEARVPMNPLNYLPSLPPASNPVVLFGLLLLAGFAGGEIARRLVRLPRITGYVLTGLYSGPLAGTAVPNNRSLVKPSMRARPAT